MELKNELLKLGYKETNDALVMSFIEDSVQTIIINGHRMKSNPNKIDIKIILFGQGGIIDGDDINTPYEFVNISIWKNNEITDEYHMGVPLDELDKFIDMMSKFHTR